MYKNYTVSYKLFQEQQQNSRFPALPGVVDTLQIQCGLRNRAGNKYEYSIGNCAEVQLLNNEFRLNPTRAGENCLV